MDIVNKMRNKVFFSLYLYLENQVFQRVPRGIVYLTHNVNVSTRLLLLIYATSGLTWDLFNDKTWGNLHIEEILVFLCVL